MTRAPTVLALALAVGLLLPAGSSAERLGPDLTPDALGSGAVARGCQPGHYSPCSFVNLHSSNTDAPVVAPYDGIITRWRFRGGCCTEAQTETLRMTLKTFRPGTLDGTQQGGGYAYIVPVNTGPTFEIPPGNQVSGEDPVELPARLPIQAGHRAGIVADNPIFISNYDPASGVRSTVIAADSFYQGEQYGYYYESQALAINVEIEPDVDGDGYGDHTQDCKADDPTQHGGCVPPSPPFPPNSVAGGGPCTGQCGGGAAVAIIGVPQPASSGDGSVVYVPLSCPAGATQPCGGYLIAAGKAQAGASAKQKVLGRVRYSIAPGKRKRVRLRLSRAAAKRLRRRGRLTILLTVKPDQGAARTVRRTLRWRKPARRRN